MGMLGRVDWHNERGAAAVEFALVAVVLVMLVFGIIEFGRTYSEYEVLTSAAREGARVAAVRGTAADITTRITAAASGYAIGPGVPAANRVCAEVTRGLPVTVSWTQNFDISIPFLPDWTQTKVIAGVFRCE
jgi:Flp pilus assembly protein TadG